MKAKTIVILRAPEEAGEIAAAIEARGFESLVEPVLHIEFLKPELPEMDKDTPLVFTSSNGVRGYCRVDDRRSSPVYAVGRNTADEARRSGFQRIESAFGTVEELVELMTGPARVNLKPPLYIRGAEISQDLKALCAVRDLTINEIVAYRADPAEKLSIDLLKKADSREIAAVMVFSPRGATVFADLVQQYDRTLRMKTIKALCIGEGVVHSLSVLPFPDVIVAPTPDRYGMIKLLDRLT